MTDTKTSRLIVRARDWFCNIPITHIEKDGSVVTAWNGEEFVGMFDLGAVDALYVSEMREG